MSTSRARRIKVNPTSNNTPDDLVADLVRRAGVFDASRQPLGNPQPALHLRQEQNAAIRRQLTAIKPGDDRLAADR